VKQNDGIRYGNLRVGDVFFNAQHRSTLLVLSVSTHRSSLGIPGLGFVITITGQICGDDLGDRIRDASYDPDGLAYKGWARIARLDEETTR